MLQIEERENTTSSLVSGDTYLKHIEVNLINP
jgi:hypothetical protein